MAVLILNDGLVSEFIADEPVHIGGLAVTAFSKLHDAAHPHSFTVACDNIKVGVFTDIGAVCENLILHFRQCMPLSLKLIMMRNYLKMAAYPFHLKAPYSRRHGASFKQAGAYPVHGP